MIDEGQEDPLEAAERQLRLEIADLIIGKSLFSSISIEKDESIDFDRAQYATWYLQDGGPEAITFDTYCIHCRQDTPFRISPRPASSRGIGPITKNAPALSIIYATCQRAHHVYTYVILKLPKILMKIGQYPSSATIGFNDLRPIEKSLDKLDREELGAALGLFSHETAIGAFVYLRRVFERMIARAHERKKAESGAIPNFDSMPMEERIKHLRGELPARVVNQSKVFSILSLGLHELSEDKCRAYFPALKAVIFQMLEQEEHTRKAALAEKETDRAIDAILSAEGGAKRGK